MDVSGDAGGGEILVGGDYQGKNPDIFNADYVNIDTLSEFYADSLRYGQAGKVIVWSDKATQFFGKIFEN